MPKFITTATLFEIRALGTTLTIVTKTWRGDEELPPRTIIGTNRRWYLILLKKANITIRKFWIRNTNFFQFCVLLELFC